MTVADEQPRPCPGCGTLAFMGENTGRCGYCVQTLKLPQHEPQARMFDHAPSMRGQLGLDT